MIVPGKQQGKVFAQNVEYVRVNEKCLQPVIVTLVTLVTLVTTGFHRATSRYSAQAAHQSGVLTVLV